MEFACLLGLDVVGGGLWGLHVDQELVVEFEILAKSPTPDLSKSMKFNRSNFYLVALTHVNKESEQVYLINKTSLYHDLSYNCFPFIYM